MSHSTLGITALSAIACTLLLPGIAPATGGDAQQALRQDPRLQSGITADLRQPTIRELLALLHQQTGVPLTADDSLADATATPGLSLQGTPAWLVMDQVAQSLLAEGRWEATPDGYELFGTPKAPPPPSAAKDRSGTTPIAFLAVTGLLVIAVARIIRSRTAVGLGTGGPNSSPQVSAALFAVSRPGHSWPLRRILLWVVLADLALCWRGAEWSRCLKPERVATGGGGLMLQDFFQEWASARNWFVGLPVYTSHHVTAPRYIDLHPVPADPFFPAVNAHPPTAVLLALPLGVLSFPHAFLVWNLLSLAALLLSL